MSDSDPNVPEGFELFESSPFAALVGPFFVRPDEPPTFGLVIEERHLNTWGSAHGAVLTALVDLALGHGVLSARGDGPPLVTAGLTTDFAFPVPLGTWIHAQADIQRLSRRAAYASCFVMSDGQRAVRASGIYISLSTSPEPNGT